MALLSEAYRDVEQHAMRLSNHPPPLPDPYCLNCTDRCLQSYVLLPLARPISQSQSQSPPSFPDPLSREQSSLRDLTKNRLTNRRIISFCRCMKSIHIHPAWSRSPASDSIWYYALASFTTHSILPTPNLHIWSNAAGPAIVPYIQSI